MSEYVKIKRRLYDELIETKAKYIVLCQMIESLKSVYEQNKPEEQEGERCIYRKKTCMNT
jgi:hypothetical protein